jgi:SpoVK/Ycf46/Vps4 family AAA+-type ATPase
MSDKTPNKDFLSQIEVMLTEAGIDPEEIETFEIREIPDSVPPEKALDAYRMVKDYFTNLDKMARAAIAFEDLLPKRKVGKPPYTEKYFKNDFFGFKDTERIYRLQETLSPVGVALIALQEFFAQSRFVHYDPRTLPEYKKMIVPLTYEEPIYIPVSLGSNKFTVPDQREMWIEDTQHQRKYVIHYGVMSGGSLKIQIESAWEQNPSNQALLQEIKDSVLTSKYFRGQVLELTPRGFSVLDLPEQKMPIIDKALKYELEKNVINMFSKAEKFREYGLPSKRAIILEGVPGNGKTMVARYLAYTLKGQVTVLWVTAKAINSPGDISQIFDLARKLSPVLLIMEDIDLIAGTRDVDSECLGEMLNQLDGIQPNESLVLVASTNVVKALDVALRDRPGRFDRIYKIGKPSAECAEQIARYYLRERGVEDSIIDSLSFTSISQGDLTGAQIVEVVKGGIFEAVHRSCEINDLCLSASYRGLVDQRKWSSDGV